MGLDQYAFAVPCDDAKGLPDVEAKLPDTADKVWQWRKHANLQGWMEHLYRTRGGGGDFNCKTVRLALHDLDQLELDIISHALPYTEGFFFGESSPEDDADTLAFVKAARQRIQDNCVIYYDSWW